MSVPIAGRRLPLIFALLWATVVATVIVVPPGHAAATWTTVKGSMGQSLTVAKSKGLIDKQDVMVSGRNFNTKIGIYVAYCVIPKPGQRPDPCYGGINIDQSSNGSMWVSSNPPWYGWPITTKYGPNGTFRFPILVSKTIDNYDCTKIKCGIVSRADHTRSNYRKADVFIPITFK